MTCDQATGIARFSGLLSEPARVRMCLALLDGGEWSMSRLAELAGVAPSTASEHVDRLVAGGVLKERRSGRNRFLSLSGWRVAEIIERLQGLSRPEAESTTLRRAQASEALTRARTCYDHLAGRLGVAVTRAMIRQEYLTTDSLSMTDAGIKWLSAEFGLTANTIQATKRPLTLICTDWTEREPHLAGLAGAAICSTALREGWIRRVGSGRAVAVTPSGEETFAKLFGAFPLA